MSQAGPDRVSVGSSGVLTVIHQFENMTLKLEKNGLRF
jgi:hypothetical protein